MVIIAIRPAGGGSYAALVDPALLPIFTNWMPKMTALAQEEMVYGGENYAVYARGNRKWVMRTEIVTNHASPDAALLYVPIQADSIADQVDIKITEGASSIYLVAAVLTDYDPDEYSGKSNRIRYSFVSGKLTSAAP